MFAGAVVVIASSHSGSAKSTEVTVIVLLYQHFFRSTFWRVLSCFCCLVLSASEPTFVCLRLTWIRLEVVSKYRLSGVEASFHDRG